MVIQRMIDIEDEVRKALSGHLTVYCRPLPKNFQMPCILVSKTGGFDEKQIDHMEIVLDSRADTEYNADLTLRNAIGILKAVSAEQTTAIRHVQVNSSGSWGQDPVRPDIALCSASLTCWAHPESITI